MAFGTRSTLSSVSTSLPDPSVLLHRGDFHQQQRRSCCETLWTSDSFPCHLSVFRSITLSKNIAHEASVSSGCFARHISDIRTISIRTDISDQSANPIAYRSRIINLSSHTDVGGKPWLSSVKIAPEISRKKAIVLAFRNPIIDEAGGGEGAGSGGSGWGNGGGGDGRGGEEDHSSDKKQGKGKGMSMSQKLTLAYAALVGVGGLIGYLKSGSTKSLISGLGAAAVLFYVHTQLPAHPQLASSIGLGVSALLLVVMGSRFRNSGKLFPAGVVALFSFIMTGGYVHGIIRSSHSHT